MGIQMSELEISDECYWNFLKQPSGSVNFLLFCPSVNSAGSIDDEV